MAQHFRYWDRDDNNSTKVLDSPSVFCSMNYSAVDTLWLATTAVPLIDDWIRKIGVHLYNGMLLSVEKKAKDLPLIAKRKKLEGVMPIKVS